MTCFFAKITPFESGGESFLLYFFHKDRNYPVGITTSIIMTKVLFSHFARLSMGILIPIFVVVFKSTWEISRGVSIALDVGLASYIFFFSLMSLIFFKPQKIKPVIRALSALPLIRRFNKLKIDEWVNKFNKIMDDFKEVRGKLLTTKRSDLVLVGIYSFLCWIFIFCVPVFLLKGMGIHSPIIHVLTIAIFYQIASAYAPTPGSSGVAEIGFASLFSILVPHSLLFVFVILWRGVTHYMVILVGAIFTIKEAIVQRRKLKSLPVRSA
jgi:uncharacterized protein (TIRG00374 family)